MRRKKSKFTSYRKKRFNNVFFLFFNATALLFHREDLSEFLTEYNEHSNLKLFQI